MKFTPSSYLSSSSTSNSFSENFYSSKGTNFGCLTGFLSRILCSKTLPTHPSAPIENHKQRHFFKNVDGSTTPNVVAKLMGLDSMPEFSSRIPQKVSYSIKSTNSGDLREETAEHRREKTSFSFRETPDYFELEDDDFFFPSEPEKKTKKKKNKKGVKYGKTELGVKGQKHRGRREKCGIKQGRNKDEQGKGEERVFSIEERLSLKISAQNSQKFDNNVDVRNQSYRLSPLKDKPSSRKKESDGIKAKKKKKKENCLVDSKEEATECDSENLSPVSVLDHSEFISDPEAASATSEEDVKMRGGSHPARDLGGKDFACEESNENSMWEGEARERVGNGVRVGVGVGLLLDLKKRKWRKHEKAEMLNRVYRLAEAEIGNNSNWKYRERDRRRRTQEELEDAGTQFGQLIFDQLVTELVHQLVGRQCQTF